MRKQVWLGVGVISALIALTGCTHDAAKAMSQFYENPGAEETLMDPLILCGEECVPTVLEAVKDRGMKRRRYAIAFLGNGGFREAIPTLKIILGDSTEKDYFQADALEAIAAIDEREGRELATLHRNGSGLLGRVAGLMAQGRYPIERRSFFTALMSEHD